MTVSAAKKGRVGGKKKEKVDAKIASKPLSPRKNSFGRPSTVGGRKGRCAASLRVSPI